MAQRTATSRTVRLLLIVLAVGLLGWITWPLATPFFVAGVLAGALSPLQERLAKRLRGRRAVAAGIIVIVVVMALILPTGTLTAMAVKEGIEGVNYIRTAFQAQGLAGLVARLPASLQVAGQRLMDALPESFSLSGAQGASAAAAVGGILSATTRAVVQTVLAIIALFFFLTDGKRLIQWMDDVIPLGHGQLAELLGEFRRVSVAVLLSTVATAAAQTAAAAAGYLIARVPNTLFFILVTFFMAFVPAAGATSVSVFLAVVLYFTGRGVGWSIFLLAWGLGVVGLIDNLVKPLFIKGGLELHGAVVFFALIGGLAAMGGVGLIAGPLIVAFFLAIVRMEQREQRLLQPLDSPPKTP